MKKKNIFLVMLHFAYTYDRKTQTDNKNWGDNNKMK